MFFTQNGQHSVVLQYFHGAWANKVDSLEGVSLADEELPRSWEAGPDDEGEGAQAAPAGRLKERQLQQLFIQVHGDVSPQLIWEVLQQLWRESEGKHWPQQWNKGTHSQLQIVTGYLSLSLLSFVCHLKVTVWEGEGNRQIKPFTFPHSHSRRMTSKQFLDEMHLKCAHLLKCLSEQQMQHELPVWQGSKDLCKKNLWPVTLKHLCTVMLSL